VTRIESVRRAAEQWAKALTDPSGRNRLLFYRPLKLGTLDLGGADPASLRRLLAAKPGTTVPLSQLFRGGPAEGEGSVADAVRRGRAVSRKATENFEERGVNTLFLVQGMATWEPPAGGSSAQPAAPVLMCAIGLHRRGASEADFDLSLDGEWTLNDALLRHLAREFNVDVSGEDLLGSKLSDARLDDAEVAEIFGDLTAHARRVPGFGIERGRLVVGNFMYRKMPMVSDIESNIEALAEHDLIAAITGDGDALEALRGEHTHEVDPALPDATPPGDEYLVLDADSSQNRAINAALAGESFVLQGPPGTGKSQTIANLVAAMMARGRSVLFVAEKRAAIDAVLKRLEGADLDGLVMDYHGGALRRRELARELDASLAALGATPPAEYPELHQRLERSRADLSGYADALHRERDPWGLSFFEVQCRLLDLAGSRPETMPSLVEQAGFPPAVLQGLDRDAALAVRGDVGDWAGLIGPMLAGRSPWAEAKVRDADEARQAQKLLPMLDAARAAAQAPSAALASELGMSGPGPLGSWEGLLELLNVVEQVTASLSARIFSVDVDLERLTADLASAASGPLSRAAGLLRKRDRAARRVVSELWQRPEAPSWRVALALVERARECAASWRRLELAGSPRVPSEYVAAATVHSEVRAAVAPLLKLLPECRLWECGHGELTAAVAVLIRRMADVNRLPRLLELEQRISGAGVGAMTAAVRRGELAPDQLAAAFERTWLTSIRREVLLEDRFLSGFDRKRQDGVAQDFRHDDRSHLASSSARIRRRAAESAVAACNSQRDQSELIRREAAKKTRHLPLRQLFEKAPDVLTALRPCWTMSPLDVAQTLPPRPLFDLVVFDEASQVLPCDAIPALLRAPRAMVAGDSRQLPPTVFFDGADDDESDESDGAGSLAAFESILDVMDAFLSRRPLTWHYRSTDERLIAFSNRNIYHGSLTTFPGAAGGECLRYEPVEHRPGEATDTRSNPGEVRRVVDLMIDHARQRPDESLGVIAMGRYHADRIEEELRRRLAVESSPELERFFDEAAPERAFVKNLERVQGDERDAILLSIGYGKNPAGKVVYRFGPLNQEGGERRLNVAVTRARRRMTLVSSFSHAEMDPNRTSAQGVAQLRGYLKYVETAGAELDGAEEAEPLNAFEIDVMDKLTAAGLSVVPQYGCSGYRIDFAVRHPTDPGRFVLAVEADGASYHSSPTARDRDRLRQDHLERLGWRFCRIWSTDWFNDHTRDVERVLEAQRVAVREIDSGKPGPLSRPNVGGTATPPEPPSQFADEDPADAAERSATSRRSGEEAATEHLGRSSAFAERGPIPWIPRGLKIDEHPQERLVRLADWVMSDGRLRTDEQIFEEMFERLGYGRRGHRIREALDRAIAQAKNAEGGGASGGRGAAGGR